MLATSIVKIVIMMLRSKFHTKEIALFLLISFISGAGWVLVPSQVKDVPPIFSIGYRFIFASLLILSIAYYRREKMYDPKVIKLVLFQGILMFPLNYLLTYSACKYTTSGLVGLISSMAIVPSYVIGLLLNKDKFSYSSGVLLLLSILGLFFIFNKEFGSYTHNTLGVILAIASVVVTAFSLYIIPHIKGKTNLSILTLTGQAMLVGGIFSLLLGLFLHQTLIYSYEERYISGLLILGVLSPIVYVTFFSFSNKYGAVFASYVWVIAPLFSILMSIIFEGYRPDKLDLIGIVLVITSCIMINKKIAKNQKDKKDGPQ